MANYGKKYKELVRQLKEEIGHCQLCGAKEGDSYTIYGGPGAGETRYTTLVGHHPIPVQRLDPDQVYDPKYTTLLCKRCHNRSPWR